MKLFFNKKITDGKILLNISRIDFAVIYDPHTFTQNIYSVRFYDKKNNLLEFSLRNKNNKYIFIFLKKLM